MKKFIFPTIVILLAVIISILFLIFTAEKSLFISNNDKNPDSNNFNEDSVDAEESREEINDQEETNPSLNGGSSESGGGSGGGGSFSSSRVTGPYCPQISYALRNFIKNSECLSSSDGTCTNKNVYCSVTVENLDQSIGQFTIEISLYNYQALIIQQFQISKIVSQSQQVIFDKTLSFQSQSEDGDANKEYDCSFKTLEIPKKSGC